MRLLDPLRGRRRPRPSGRRRQAAEQAAALGQQQGAVLEAEHTRDAGRRVLADAVAEHHVRLDAPRLPEPGQAHLHREQGGLGVAGLLQGVVRRRPGQNDVQQRPFEHVGDRRRAPVHASANTGSVSNSSRAMPATDCPDPGNSHAVFGLSAQSPRTRPGAGRSSASAPSFTGGLGRVDHQGGPVLEVGSPHPGGEAYVGQRGLRVRAQPAAVVLRDLHQGGRGSRRQREQAEPSVVGWSTCRCRSDLSARCLFEDDVRVGPGEPERADSRRCGAARARSHGRASSTTRTGSRSQGMCGDGFRKCRCLGSASCSSDRMTLMTPAMPAAASRCPMLVFTDRSAAGGWRRAPRRVPHRRPGPRSGHPAMCRSRAPPGIRRRRRRDRRSPAPR